MSIPLPKLQPPSSRLIVEQSHLDHPQSRHLQIIKDHPFNYTAETIIPNCREDPELTECFASKYYEARIQASSLIHPAFIEAFIKRGTLQLLSSQRKIDADDVLAITPKGVLCLNLTKTSYQMLGLDGQVSKYSKKHKLKYSKKRKLKYIVEIDLLKPYFQPERKNYERVRQCLLENHSQFYDVLFTWKPQDEAVAPISVSKYFQMVGYECKEIDVDCTSHVMTSVTCCPVLDPSSIAAAGEGRCVDYQEFWEWLGAIGCNIDVKNKSEVRENDEFLSMYTCPEPSRQVEGVYRETVTGLVSTAEIQSRLNQLREIAAVHGWCSLTVCGFTDAPVTWNTKEHGYLTDGDNSYTFIIFPDGTYWLYYALSSHDECP